MFHLDWSASEKKIAREAYDCALRAAKAKVLAAFKERANAAASVDDMWAMETWLHEQRKEMREMFDYRYSRLPLFFLWAVRTGLIEEGQLAGLSEDKLQLIRRLRQPWDR